MTTRVNPQLWETSAGKYAADVGITLKEAQELNRLLQTSLADLHKQQKTLDDPEQRRIIADRTEILSNVASYVADAYFMLKIASNKRQQGRWNANHKNI